MKNTLTLFFAFCSVFLLGQSSRLSPETIELKASTGGTTILMHGNLGTTNYRHGRLLLYKSTPTDYDTKVDLNSNLHEGGHLALYNGSGHPSAALYGDFNSGELAHQNHGNLSLLAHSVGTGTTSGYITPLISFYNVPLFHSWDIGLYDAHSTAGVGLGTYIAYQYEQNTVATVRNDGRWHQWSDARFKTNIQNIGDIMTKIQQLNPSKYEMKNTPGKEEYGFIAQDLIKQFPELVFHLKNEEEDHYLVNYSGMIPILTKAIQTQQNQLKVEESILLEQENTLANLKSEVNNLKQAVKNLIQQKGKNTQIHQLSVATLGQNRPNPFHNQTAIPYSIPENSQTAKILIHHINGQLIQSIVLKQFGEGVLELHTDQLGSGQYTYSLEVDGRVLATKKMNLQR